MNILNGLRRSKAFTSIDKSGSLAFLNGDEAVARGAVEAGVRVATSYPGTPATEILEAIAAVSKKFGIYVEWSTNEIVATEVASGAAMTGVRSIVSMKHVGLNVASDAVMTLAYTGVIGGMVIVVCDDPSMHSSQNEQDTRYFAVHASLPLLDAGNSQEAKDMTVEAFELSERLKLPIILRLTTRVSHSKGRVELGEIKRVDRKAVFDRNSTRWTMVPSNAIRQHRILHESLGVAKKLAEESGLNTIEDNKSRVGIVGSGIGYYYARSILDKNRFSWLKLGFVNPFPKDLVRNFATSLDRIVVVEELRPYIEDNVRSLDIEVLGKKELGLEELNEFTPDILRSAFVKHGLCTSVEKKGLELELPPRPPVLCPGCTHRAFFYALNTVGKNKVVTGDIGCYTLGALPPLTALQTCLCMGAGISQAAGIRHAGVSDTIFAVIGDSTFLHAGMPGLLNIAYNNVKVCVAILDNQTVAMTGHQPTPETGRRVTGEKSKSIRIEDVVKALGIDEIEVVDPYDVVKTRKVIEKIMQFDGPSVIISRRPCALLVERGSVRHVTEKCSSCGACVKVLGCPAISIAPDGAEIDSTLCRGCGVCETVCPYMAIVSET